MKPNTEDEERYHTELDRFDTTTNTLPGGWPRCAYRYKDVEDAGTEAASVEWARCTRPATTAVPITEDGNRVLMVDIEDDKSYEIARVCDLHAGRGDSAQSRAAGDSR